LEIRARVTRLSLVFAYFFRGPQRSQWSL